MRVLWREWVFLALLFAAGIFAYAWLAAKLYGLGIISSYGVLFDTDPTLYLDAMAHGWGLRSPVHPHLPNLFMLPSRALASILGGDTEAVREQVAIWYAPAASAAKLVLLYALLRMLDFKKELAAIFVLFVGVSFTQIIFAALPESFGLTSFFTAVLMLWAAMVLSGRSHDKAWVWYAVGFCFIGTSGSNAALFGFILFFVRWHLSGDFLRTGFRAVAETVGLFLVVVLTGYGFDLLLDPETPYFGAGAYERFVMPFWRFAEHLAYFPAQLGLTVWPQAPTVLTSKEDYEALYRVPLIGDWQMTSFTYQVAAKGLYANLVGWLVTLLAVGGGLLAWRQEGEARPLALASGCIILFGGILHSFYGVETYLYSHHWQIPMFLMLAFVCRELHERARWAFLVGFAAMILALSLQSLTTIQQMLAYF